MPEAEQVCRGQEPEESQAQPGQTRGGRAGGGSTKEIHTHKQADSYQSGSAPLCACSLIIHVFLSKRQIKC